MATVHQQRQIQPGDPGVRATNMSDYPTPWQRKMMWAALTAFCVVLLIVIIGTVIWASANVISFLQPILIPVAIAVILTYLLDPLVTKMSRGTLSRTKAVALLFAIAFFALGGLAAWLVPTISIQSANFARQVPAYTERARSDSLAVAVRNLHRQVLQTGSSDRHPLLLLMRNRLSLPPQKPLALRLQLKRSRRARQS